MTPTKKTVTVIIAPDGAITAETHEVKGDACLDLIPKIERLTDAITVDSNFNADHSAVERATEPSSEWSFRAQDTQQQDRARE